VSLSQPRTTSALQAGRSLRVSAGQRMVPPLRPAPETLVHGGGNPLSSIQRRTWWVVTPSHALTSWNRVGGRGIGTMVHIRDHQSSPLGIYQ
jgi:hypothetical protein